MTTRITFFNRNGTRAAEIEGTCTRTWTLNAMGRALIQLPLDDIKLTLGNTDFGQFVYIEHPRVGAWGGKVMPPYDEYDTEGYAQLNAYTGEYMLKQRRIVNKSFTGTAGQIFSQVIALANQQEDTRLKVGQIASGGLSWTEKVDFSSCYDVLVSIAKKSGQYWSIEPAIDVGGLLYFSASWHERRGRDWPAAVRFEEGTHTEAARGVGFSVQGEIANDVLIYGTSGSQSSKIFAPAIDVPSVGQWGLSQLTVGVSDTDQASLNSAVKTVLAQNKQPTFIPRVVLLDVACGGGSSKAFDFANLGDVVTYHRITGRYAGDHRVRTVIREFDERAGKLALTMQKAS